MSDSPASRSRVAGPRAGLALEEQVASLYRALAYEVRRDVRLAGNQIDVFAQQAFAGYGRVRIAIEVKDHPGRAVPITEVRAFLNVARLLLDAKECDRAVMVTSGTFTANSKVSVDSVGNVELLTFEDLERQVLASDDTLVRWLLAHRDTVLNRRYVDLRATLLDFESPKVVKAPGVIEASSLLNVALAHPHSAIFVFADYGAGKTTVLERLKAQAIEARMQDGSAVVPVFIPLKNMTDGTDAERLVLARLPSELGVSLPSQVFWDLHAAGRFLFLLDGFDEITLRADAAKRTQLLSTLSPLLFGPSPAILTSRPSYFADTAEYQESIELLRSGGRSYGGVVSSDPASQRVKSLADRLTARYREAGPLLPRSLNYLSYRLDPLTSEQIDQFLEASRDTLLAVGIEEPSDVRQFLSNIYDLSDLITRPIILDMAVATIEDGTIDITKGTLANGPAGLYDAYTSSKLQADYEKALSRRDFLSHDERMAFAELCAEQMAIDDQAWVSDSEAGRLAKKALQSEGAPLDEILTDLRTCSFLTVDADGALQFIHRSFQEYFYARKLRTELTIGRSRMLATSDRWEYLYFLGAFAYTDNDFYNTLFELARTSDRSEESAAVADNAARAFLAARETATSIEWLGRRIGRIVRTRLAIRRARLIDTEFLDLQVENLEISDSTIGVAVSSAGRGSLVLRDCDGEASLRGAIGTVEIEGGRLAVNDRSDSAISLKSTRTRLSRDESRGRLNVEDTTGDFRLAGGEVTIRSTTGALQTRERLDGYISESRLEINLATLDRLATTTTASAFLVRGDRGAGSIRKVQGEARGCLFIVSSAVRLGAWWRQNEDNIIVGGHVEGPPSRWPAFTGLTFTEAKQSKPGEASLEAVPHGEGIVVRGCGDDWDTAHATFQAALDHVRLHHTYDDFIASLRHLAMACKLRSKHFDELLLQIGTRWSRAGDVTAP